MCSIGRSGVSCSRGAPLWLADGLQYEGQWREDVYDGLGTLALPSGERYTGHWAQGRKEGTGVHEVPGDGGYTYEGDFRDDRHPGACRPLSGARSPSQYDGQPPILSPMARHFIFWSCP